MVEKKTPAKISDGVSDEYEFGLKEDYKESHHLISTSINLVKKHFNSVSEIQFMKEHDPETCDQWIVVEVTLADDIDNVLYSYDNYTQEWINMVPEVEQEQVRLSYNII